MSVIMSLAIAFFLPFMNGTPGEDFVELWLGGTFAGFLISFPVSLVAVPLVRKMVAQLVE
jgi:hypothetical protein